MGRGLALASPHSAIVAIVGVCAMAASAAGATCEGRYVLTSATGSLVHAPGDVIVLDIAKVVVDPVCGDAAIHARGRSRLAARWRGCRGRRALRLKLRASADCTLLRGTVSAPGARASRFIAVASRCGDGIVDEGLGERCDDANQDPADGCDASCGRCVDPATFDGTWAAIQANVFDARCIVCHGETATLGLDLRGPGSYARIVGVPASLGRFEIAPGSRTQSLLWLKLAMATFGSSGDDIGGGMPFGYPLPPDVVLAVGAWIDAGAPASGFVVGAEALLIPCGG
jgi:cysteine-rich repeat protein